tara:strand:- start:1197 stop:1469 length:273 start_codon:yes stop_codon:yes gene_type:complete
MMIEKAKDLWASCKGQPLWIRIIILLALITVFPILWKSYEIILKCIAVLASIFFVTKLFEDEFHQVQAKGEEFIEQYTNTTTAQPPMEED